MNKWISKRDRRLSFKRFQQYQFCLWNDQEESVHYKFAPSLIWNFTKNFSWLGWRIYDTNSQLVFSTLFDQLYENYNGFGGSVELDLNNFAVNDIKVRDLLSEFKI